MSKMIIDADGNKEWWFNGKLHREGGPAVEWSNGTKCWYLNGKCHREDGPAVEWEDGTSFWYLNNIAYSKEDWFEMLPEDLRIKALFNESFING
jgi:hypothetical protein